MEKMLLSDYIAMLQKLKKQHGNIIVISDSGCDLSAYYSDSDNVIIVNWQNRTENTESTDAAKIFVSYVSFVVYTQIIPKAKGP